MIAEGKKEQLKSFEQVKLYPGVHAFLFTRLVLSPLECKRTLRVHFAGFLLQVTVNRKNETS